jgi:hypothetical protein
MLNLDIAHAFDSVSWDLLFEVLQKVGFGPRLRELVAIFLSTASTRVFSMASQAPQSGIRGAWGLRQGDLSSPMLLVLFINSLNKLLAKAKELGVLKPIAPVSWVRWFPSMRTTWSSFVTDEVELRTVHEILALFGEASRLRTNYTKCAVSPVTCSKEEVLEAARVMECQLAPFPVKYPGIPLTVGRLPALVLQPLIDNIADRLPLWKAGMMTRSVSRIWGPRCDL